jgi:hypothetical protein
MYFFIPGTDANSVTIWGLSRADEEFQVNEVPKVMA